MVSVTDGLAISIGISSTGPSQTKATSDHSGCIEKKKKKKHFDGEA